MSVINKMLQDLEQRQQPGTSASPANPSRLQKKARYGQFGPLMLLLVVLLFLGWLWINSGDKPQEQIHVDSLSQQPAPVDSAPGVNNLPDIVIDSAIPAAPVSTIDSAEHAAEKKNLDDVSELQQIPTQPATTPQTTAKAHAVQAAPENEPQPAAEPAIKTQPQLKIETQVVSAKVQQANMQLQAAASEAAGDISEAIVIWQQIIAKQPTDADGYLNLARLWLKQQQIVSAHRVLLQARQQGVFSAEINMQLAQLAIRQGQWQQALLYLSDPFELTAEPEYFGLKATVLQQLAQYDEAFEWYKRLHQLQPQQGRWSLGAALASEQLGQVQQANKYYQHAWQYRQVFSASSHDFIQQRLKATEP